MNMAPGGQCLLDNCCINTGLDRTFIRHDIGYSVIVNGRL